VVVLDDRIGLMVSLWRSMGEKLVADAGRSGASERCWPLQRPVEAAARLASQALHGRSAATTVLSLIALLAVGIEDIYTYYGPGVASFIQPLRSGQLSRLDTAALERGYYEQLLRVDRFNAQLWEVYSKRPKNWLDTQGGQLKRHTGGFAQTDLIPSFVATYDFGKVSTNRWGMRDQDYELKPAPGVQGRPARCVERDGMGRRRRRGPSRYWSKRDSTANRAARRSPGTRFSISASRAITAAAVGGARALGFSPDAVFYVATGREISRAAWYLVEVVQKREIRTPSSRIVAKAGLAADMDEATALRRRSRFRAHVLSAMYRRVVGRRAPAASCRCGSSCPRSGKGAGRKRRPNSCGLPRTQASSS
jgi:hypothetical protein